MRQSRIVSGIIAITVITLAQPPRALPAENSKDAKESIGRLQLTNGVAVRVEIN